MANSGVTPGSYVLASFTVHSDGRVTQAASASVTGTGNVALSDSPVFTTNITAPIVKGGSGTTSTLTLRATSGVGTTGSDIIFQVGNNGATEAMRINSGGSVRIGTGTPAQVRQLEIHLTSSGILQSAFLMQNNANATSTGTGMLFGALDSGNNQTNYGGIAAQITDNTDGSEDGDLLLREMIAGTLTAVAKFTVGSFVMGGGALATNATDGFLYIAGGAGAPTGTPTAQTGRVPLYYDTTNNQFYVYNGGWKKVTLA
jgi:hypothetical protein